mmetsp:Transcript_44780/g.85629  ORF Transcript_44780/g.85629 Transcript_44780/m.85629 type:complete len:376 (+) Transcript_44780:854-1981(+)
MRGNSAVYGSQVGKPGDARAGLGVGPVVLALAEPRAGRRAPQQHRQNGSPEGRSDGCPHGIAPGCRLPCENETQCGGGAAGQHRPRPENRHSEQSGRHLLGGGVLKDEAQGGSSVSGCDGRARGGGRAGQHGHQGGGGLCGEAGDGEGGCPAGRDGPIRGGQGACGDEREICSSGDLKVVLLAAHQSGRVLQGVCCGACHHGRQACRGGAVEHQGCRTSRKMLQKDGPGQSRSVDSTVGGYGGGGHGGGGAHHPVHWWGEGSEPAHELRREAGGRVRGSHGLLGPVRANRAEVSGLGNRLQDHGRDEQRQTVCHGQVLGPRKMRRLHVQNGALLRGGDHDAHGFGRREGGVSPHDSRGPQAPVRAMGRGVQDANG